ncbi:unnamed protein product [Heterosigma akashiwo]|uniref:Uncharacterized protein n=2 Tax=Heterosigma akashiwo TaxID=2829 RepID=A0A6V1Q9E6_HETAK|mmetsp:Transcript_11081/g.15533  ORF Transcript_11081/g.15533 Transcript_11081/m.15533 type:complete len:409 (+) Transcript_11081:128-1354(+)|eukprot:CAMPEP_0194583322 /NCGR_PEP_ID=MMETSP0292-20121207/16248_1 /TAXON_ID=39354 /ORGANISM="Heterosigma akashiwo, Strain CCMP2393" /LENGTH=408 /DNA_ID=CAMNT_0039437877 /DNA_START=65 /DNA_END=1294 /DNA_ORIENTATION=-
MAFMRVISFLALLVALACVHTNAFKAPTPPQVVRSTSKLMMSTPAKPAEVSWLSPEFDMDDYKERARVIKRTVYDHEDWRRHRSSKRYLRNLSTLADSEIFRSLRNQLLAVTGVATFIVTYNALIGTGFDTDFGMHIGKLAVKPLPFSICTGSLSLLLAFRTNDAYSRWAEARKIWGSTIQRCFDLVRSGLTYMEQGDMTDEEFANLKKELTLRTIAYARVQKGHFRDGPEEAAILKAELAELLGEEEAERICSAAHKPCRVIQDLSELIRAANLTDMKRQILDNSVAAFCDTVGASERIFKTPVPLVYTRHTSRFMSLWLLLLPMALYRELGTVSDQLLTIPTSAIIAFFLLGIEELGIQLEEPFSILPLEAMCDGIERTCLEMMYNDLGEQGYFDDTELCSSKWCM